MKKNLKIIFLLLAVVGILVIALLLIFCNVSLADVSLDTFFGVMVTMIGILVTFAVGWQIINALEIKNKLAEIEKLKVEINSQREKIEKISARSRYDIALNRSYMLYKSEECVKAFVSALEAIQYCLQIDEYEELDTILNNLKEFAAASYNQSCYSSDKDTMIATDFEIRKSPKFVLIKDRYEDAIRVYNMFPKCIINDKKHE